MLVIILMTIALMLLNPTALIYCIIVDIQHHYYMTDACHCVETRHHPTGSAFWQNMADHV